MIIAVCGKKGSGKDSIANYLIEKYGFKREKFADPIKKIALIMYPTWGERHIEGDLKEIVDPEYGISPRQVMQVIGDDFAQKFLCENFPEYRETTGRKLWVRNLIKRIDLSQNYVISDMRYVHESHELHDKVDEVLIVKVERSSINNKDEHRSENQIRFITPDRLFTNDQGLDVLYKKVDNMIESSNFMREN